jgi:hypothetical protein
MESLRHCAGRNGGVSFHRDLEKEESNFRLGTINFDMIVAVEGAV